MGDADANVTSSKYVQVFDATAFQEAFGSESNSHSRLENSTTAAAGASASAIVDQVSRQGTVAAVATLDAVLGSLRFQLTAGFQ